MRSILMVAFHYPPASGSGYLRTLKFSKYLLEFGWKPYILTVREGTYNIRDLSMVEDVPKAIQVFREFSFDTRKRFSFQGKYLDIFAIPDGYLSWLPFAVIKGVSIIKKNKLDMLYSTSPVPTAHLIGLVLRKITKLPWIADFRDPWVEENLNPNRRGLRYRLDSYLEKMVIMNADKVITTTELLRTEIMERYPYLSNDKFCVVTNGFDEDDFNNITAQRKESSERFELIHTGLVNGSYRNPEPLLLAIKSLIEEKKLSKDDIVLKFLGGESYLNSSRFKNTLTALGIEDIVEVVGRVSYNECIQYLFRSRVLVILQGGDDTKTLIPAKAFEYLRVKKPILALTLKGATSDLIKKFNAGIVVNPEKIEDIKKAILEFYWMFKNNCLEIKISEDMLKGYSRKELTRKLVTILDNEISPQRVETHV